MNLVGADQTTWVTQWSLSTHVGKIKINFFLCTVVWKTAATVVLNETRLLSKRLESSELTNGEQVHFA